MHKKGLTHGVWAGTSSTPRLSTHTSHISLMCVCGLLSPASKTLCSVLTPYKHYFRALTGSLVTYLLLSQGANRRTLTTLVMCLGLAVSQDALAAYNKGQLQDSVQQLLQQIKLQWQQKGSTAGVKQQQQQQQQLAASRTKLHVKGMRCEGW